MWLTYPPKNGVPARLIRLLSTACLKDTYPFHFTAKIKNVYPELGVMFLVWLYFIFMYKNAMNSRECINWLKN
jgi:hypothetical protein